MGWSIFNGSFEKKSFAVFLCKSEQKLTKKGGSNFEMTS